MWKNKLITPQNVTVKTQLDREVKGIYEAYEGLKKKNHIIDYDDMLVDTYEMLVHRPNVLRMIQNRFDYIFVDEFQDTSPVQSEILKLIAFPKNNICCVGDDKQSIYAFRGADTNTMLEFEKVYPGSKIFSLDINYRSHDFIVGLGNAVISHNLRQREQNLKALKKGEVLPLYIHPNDTQNEANHIVQSITSEVYTGNREYRDYAILYRTTASSRAIFEELIIKKVPFVTKAKEVFYEGRFVKPVVDYLRLSLDLNNLEAIKGILPSFYLNREKTMSVLEKMIYPSTNGKMLFLLLEIPELKDFQYKNIAKKISLIESLKGMSPVAAIQRIRQEGEYDKYLEADQRQTLSLHKEIIKEMLDELESSAKRFKEISHFLAFVDEIIQKHKEMQRRKDDPNANMVRLMTVHAAKGLEFPVVYLIGVSEGILPHKSALEANLCSDVFIDQYGQDKKTAAIEEECRIAYVAITRAKEELYISSPANYRGQKVEISRFILGPFQNTQLTK